MKKLHVLGVLILALAVLAGCAAGPNDLAGSPDKDGVVAGFWRGWWHGFISPVTFVVSHFSQNVRMYEVHNNGGWYNFGYLLGCMAIFGGGAGGGAQARKRRR
jgi:uncharacterized spore protein YtfJ